ncbi:unnamed protein product [Penicillium nalgiovense]|uniref:Ankyrin repeat protein n=1 Tax=Penicillium nalgiovense TaxID=60175 RepID=A0A9W4IHM7_PENNA|nr:unnamed protein product [Penicillium nalgiovense]CAG7982781.1 unnamed protein product [Penicillium nalgiovense]CAG8036668.1 unnamed protein product [Penicillium nalgiovense]CAG8044585.1 unnamed protein product [Penicillium nalgiovense]CAG8047758.1 unnamed protein product [Penicillium nalgiovense]
MAQNPYLLACDNPKALLDLLRSNPAIASSQDESGYSLLHAAASYGHADLLRALVKEFNVDVNILDEDGETCLFVAEDSDIARCLIEELGVDTNKKNAEDLTAVEKFEAENEFPQVAAYLREVVGGASAPTHAQAAEVLNSPGPIPGSDMRVNFGTMTEEEATAGGEPDPEFKRRIEELATREDYYSEEVQNEVRELVKDAMSGSNIEAMEREIRRRTE